MLLAWAPGSLCLALPVSAGIPYLAPIAGVLLVHGGWGPCVLTDAVGRHSLVGPAQAAQGRVRASVSPGWSFPVSPPTHPPSSRLCLSHRDSGRTAVTGDCEVTPGGRGAVSPFPAGSRGPSRPVRPSEMLRDLAGGWAQICRSCPGGRRCARVGDPCFTDRALVWTPAKHSWAAFSLLQARDDKAFLKGFL